MPERLELYLIGGPPGVGKTSTARQLAKRFARSAHIVGDKLYNFMVGGYVPAGTDDICTQALYDLTQQNIMALTNNYIKNSINVVIDYVIFPEDVQRICSSLRQAGLEANVHYAVLMASGEELLRRDAERTPGDRMGIRCLEILDRYRHLKSMTGVFIDTTTLAIEEAADRVQSISTLSGNWPQY
jgi:predicted kinase